jgi:hypothetical protein
MKHTFASSSGHSAPWWPSFVTLGNCAIRKSCKNTCNVKNIFVLRAIHSSIGHFALIGILF